MHCESTSENALDYWQLSSDLRQRQPAKCAQPFELPTGPPEGRLERLASHSAPYMVAYIAGSQVVFVDVYNSSLFTEVHDSATAANVFGIGSIMRRVVGTAQSVDRYIGIACIEKG